MIRGANGEHQRFVRVVVQQQSQMQRNDHCVKQVLVMMNGTKRRQTICTIHEEKIAGMPPVVESKGTDSFTKLDELITC